MFDKRARQIVFVCSAINDGNLISKIISAASVEEAAELFYNENMVKAETIFGPFYKKKTKVLESTREIKLGTEMKKAIYNDWFVNAFFLKEPENKAFLVFLKRVDDKKMTAPKGTIVVPISELRFE